MKMKKIKVAEATSQALNWMVAVAEGHKPPLLRVLRGGVALPREDDPMWCDYLEYTDDWAQGGPIIERENISPREERPGLVLAPYFNGVAHVGHKPGPTYLIAGMRCYVASKLGDEVEVPEELL